MKQATATMSNLIRLLGPEEAAKHARALTPDETRQVNEALTRHGGSHSAVLGVRDPQLAQEVDALFR